MDISNILKDILEYYKTSAGDKWDEVKEQAEEYLTGTEKRLLRLANETVTGELDAEFLTERAKDELSILESQSLSFGIISASFGQEIVSSTIQKFLIAIIQILTKAVGDK